MKKFFSNSLIWDNAEEKRCSICGRNMLMGGDETICLECITIGDKRSGFRNETREIAGHTAINNPQI